MVNCFDTGCAGCEECVDYTPDDAEQIPPDHWVVIEPNGGKCYGGKTLGAACLAALVANSWVDAAMAAPADPKGGETER